MKSIRAEIEINTSPGRVWDVLRDFERYPKWNPFIVELKGKLQIGERLKEKVRLPNGKEFNFTSEITDMEVPYKLVWKGHALHPALFLGLHSILLEPLDDGQRTRFIQTEDYTGLMLAFIDLEQTEQGYHQMNEALKRTVEQQSR